MFLRHAACALLLVLSGCASGGGGTSWDPLATTPDPVALPDGADPNSAHAYYAYGQSILERSPTRAAEAFYWASRVDPTWADPVYARRIALFMAEPRMFSQYLRGSRRVVASPGVQRLDSLYLRALTLNPFPRRQQDAIALRYLIVDEVMRDPASGTVSRSELDFAVRSWIEQADHTTRAWVAQSEGRFPEIRSRGADDKR